MNAGVGAITVPVPIIMSAPDRSDLLRSALESTAFAIRANVEQLEGVAGVRIPTLRVGGGMSRSALFARILTDVLDRSVELATTPETSALGAAAVSATALGLHSSLEVAVAAMTGGRVELTPDSRASAEYDDCYERWTALCERLEIGGL